jgi:hypothetical protein
MKLIQQKSPVSGRSWSNVAKLVAGTALSAILLSACSSPDTSSASATSDFGEDDYVQVCQDPATGVRVSDDKCQDNNGGTSESGGFNSSYLWYFYGMHLLNQNRGSIPGVGSVLSGGYNQSQYNKLSKNGSYYRGAPVNGGSFGKNSVKNAPKFDNSKMLPVPGDFQPPTAPAAPKTTTAPSVTTPSTAPKVVTPPKVTAPKPAAPKPAAPKSAPRSSSKR